MREAEQRVTFVNQVSHELKTPLTNIRMYAELLEGKLEEADTGARRNLGIIVSESQRLSRLIGNVLTFGRRSRGPAAPPAVWDEAFLPLSAGAWTRGRPGWALGSLTKAFACPGLRLGYAIAPTPESAATIRERRPVWAVSTLACAVLPELVAESDPPGWTSAIAVARKATVEVLRSYGLHPWPSDAPWLLVPQAGDLRQVLAGQGIVVRDCTSFGLDDHVRIAVPDDDGLDRLDAALGNVR
jgi:hypothetical protein